MRPSVTVAISLVTLAVQSGCVTARLTQFKSFSQAGIAYTKANDAFLDQAGAAAIRGDTTQRLATRPRATEEARTKDILESNDALRVRLKLLSQIRAHGRLLCNYFEILGAMADSKSPEALSASAKGVFDAAAAIGSSIGSSRPEVAAAGTALAGATKLLVGQFKVKALEDELKLRGEPVTKELALQEAALRIISQEFKTDLKLQLNTAETRDVVEPFIGNGSIPFDWGNRRVELLMASPATASADAAALAAEKLRLTFQNLVANQLDDAGIASLIADITGVVDLAEKVKAAADKS